MDLQEASRQLAGIGKELKDAQYQASLLETHMDGFSKRTAESYKNAGLLSKMFGSHLDSLTLSSKVLLQQRSMSRELEKIELRRLELEVKRGIEEEKIEQIGRKRGDLSKQDLRRLDTLIDRLSDVDQELASNALHATKIREALTEVSGRSMPFFTKALIYSTALFVRTVSLAGDFNKSLVAANANLQTRSALFRDMLRAQVETGLASEQMLAVAKELTEQGFDLSANFSQLTKYAAMLHVGLGMSVKEAVNLAATARSANTQYEQMANTISRIVDLTATSADEAARYARELAKAASEAAGIGKTRIDLPGLTETLSNVTGALKGTMADPEEIARLIPRLTKLTDLGGLGMGLLGTGGPQFLSGPNAQQNLQDVLRNLALIPQRFGESNPVLEQFAEQLGISRITLQELSAAYAKQGDALFTQNTQLDASAKLQERYRKQLAGQNQVFGVFLDQLRALGVLLMEPLTVGLRAVNIGLSQMLGFFTSINDALYGVPATVLSGVFLITLIGGLTKLVAGTLLAEKAIMGLSRSMLYMMGASKTAQAAGTFGGLGKQLGGMLTGLFSGNILMNFGRMLLRGLTFVLTKGNWVGWIVTALMIAGPFLWNLFTGKKENARQVGESTKLRDITVFAEHYARLMAKNTPLDSPILNRLIDQFTLKASRERYTEQDLQMVSTLVGRQMDQFVSIQGRRAEIAASIDKAINTEALRKQDELIAKTQESIELLRGINLNLVASISDANARDAKKAEQTQTTRSQLAAMQSRYLLSPMR